MDKLLRNDTKPLSCDTFAVLAHDSVIFGKNSDRPTDEVQEVIYIPATDHSVPSKVRCTYIEIDQVEHTFAVILSKPSWMWGAEMGANEHNVCIGNEAVWTKLNSSSDSDEKLLGMDLLRLGLERSTNALQALDVITNLLDTYGQGGNCSNTLPDFTYHNSFLIADPNVVWVLETAGTLWAAEKIDEGVRNISNELTIGETMHRMSPNLSEFAEENGFWKSNMGPFNFKRAFGVEEDEFESYRYKSGKRLLIQHTLSGKFTESDMFKVLRDKPSGICMSSGPFVSTGSQVSVLRKFESGLPSCHWFTGTPDPSKSFFKPFIFAKNLNFPLQITSLSEKSVPVKSSDVELRHELYKYHTTFWKKHKKNKHAQIKLLELEEKYLTLANKITNEFDEDAGKLFKNAVEEEINLYS